MLRRTNIEVDPRKVARAMELTGIKTTKAVVDFALSRLADTSKGLSLMARLSGKIRFREGYSYKRSRG